MILIVCLDSRNGMAFNGRRQSRDARVIDDILDIVRDRPIYASSYTKRMFGERAEIRCGAKFMFNAGPGEFCFIETKSVSAVSDRVERLIIYRWNRHYLSDVYFDIDISEGFVLEDTYEFEGKSHPAITREVYVREKA